MDRVSSKWHVFAAVIFMASPATPTRSGRPIKHEPATSQDEAKRMAGLVSVVEDLRSEQHRSAGRSSRVSPPRRRAEAEGSGEHRERSAARRPATALATSRCGERRHRRRDKVEKSGSGRRGWRALVAVFVLEHGEQDAVHRSAVLKGAGTPLLRELTSASPCGGTPSVWTTRVKRPRSRMSRALPVARRCRSCMVTCPWSSIRRDGHILSPAMVTMAREFDSLSSRLSWSR